MSIESLRISRSLSGSVEVRGLLDSETAAICCDPSDARVWWLSRRKVAVAAEEIRRPNGGGRGSTNVVSVARARASADRGVSVSAGMASGDEARAPTACARRQVLSCQSNLRVGYRERLAMCQVVQLSASRVCRYAQLIVRRLQKGIHMGHR